MPVDRSSSYEEVTGLMKKTKNNTHIPDRMMSADNDGTVDKVKVTPMGRVSYYYLPSFFLTEIGVEVTS